MMKFKRIISGGVSVLVLLASIATFSFNNVTTAHAVEPPQIAAQGAALYNANTGEFLYEKNGDKQFYPASITKIMTALLTLEKADLDDTVVFSRSATTNLERGAVTLKITAGDRISVRDALYGMMLKSANEVANGLAEHVGGSISGFASMMNARARELGAKHTNFVNPNGLNNQNHVTTAKDMALIAAEAFKNPNFRKLVGTTAYTFPATIATGSPTVIGMGHKMIYESDSRYYPGVIGGKTGYTRSAGNTLVTGAQRNGVRLVAVVLKSPSSHYTDTKALLDYGFSIAAKGGIDIASKDKDVQKSITGELAKAAKNETDNVTVVEVNNVVEKRKDIDNIVTETQSASETKAYGPGMLSNTGWQESGGKWAYVKSDNSFAKSEVLNINGQKYWFDTDKYMATGWRQDSTGAWYYMGSSGVMELSSWLIYNGLWYYLGSDGKMLTNTTTPDGYYVNSDGVWVS